MKNSLLTVLVCILAAFPTHADPVPPHGRTLTGTAVDPQARPVAGIALWPEPELDLADEPFDVYLKAGPAAVTDAEGRFTMSLPAGAEQVDVCSPGWLTNSIDVRTTATGKVTVKVRPGARISGRVVDAAGNPIAGMPVSTQRAGVSGGGDFFPRQSPCPPGGNAAVLTDRAGRFDLTPLEPGWYTVWAAEGSIATHSPPVKLAPGQALVGLSVTATRGAEVVGRVTAKDGSPASGAKVFSRSFSTTTDREGRYRLTGLAPGQHRVGTDDRQHGATDRDVELAAGENRLDLVLPDPTEIRGRVLEPGGGGVAGATVKIWPARTATSADGTFRLSIPTCGCGKTLEVTAAGLASAEVEVQGQPGALEIRLTRPGGLAGRVLGLRSPAGTEISTSSYPSRRRLEAIADAEGRFHFPALTPGNWSVVATQQERVAVSSVVISPGQETALDIAFPITHRVSGRVVDRSGRPVPCDEIGFSRFHVPCRGDGTFAAELENGSYDPWVGIGGTGQFHEPILVEVAGSPIAGIEIRVRSWVTVAGRILGLEPSEVPDSIKFHKIGGFEGSQGSVDEDGSYSIEVFFGDWDIEAHFGRMTARRRLHIPVEATRIDADVTFSTGPYALEGRAIRGEPFLELVGPDDFTVTPSVYPDGRFRFSRLAAGTYRLRAHSMSPQLRAIPVAAGSHTVPDILLERTVQIPAPSDTEMIVDLTPGESHQ